MYDIILGIDMNHLFGHYRPGRRDAEKEAHIKWYYPYCHKYGCAISLTSCQCAYCDLVLLVDVDCMIN